MLNVDKKRNYSNWNILKPFVKVNNDGVIYMTINPGLLSEISKEEFVLFIKEYLREDYVYYVLCRARYVDDIFKMLSKQEILNTKDIESSLLNLHTKLITQLDDLSLNYGFEDSEVVSLQLRIVPIDVSRLDKFKLPNDFKIDSLPKYKKDSSPYPIDHKQYIGVNLPYEKKDTDFVITPNNLTTTIDSNSFTDTPKNVTFYLRNKPEHILAINDVGNTIYKTKYSIKGDKLTEVKDVLNQDKTITRYLNDNNIMNYDSDYSLISKELKNIKIKPINNKEVKGNVSYVEEGRIGVIDLETFKDSRDDISRVYSAGFYTSQEHFSIDKNKPKIFYIDQDTMDDSKVVLDLMDEMLREKYRGTTFYCHNLGNYDLLFILKILSNYNQTCLDEYSKYKMDIRFKDNTAMKVTFKRNKNRRSKQDSVTIIDSYGILTSSLASLGKSFNVDVIKDTFPHEFSDYNTLFYIGKTPVSDSYQPSIIKDRDWNFKEESNKYLTKDLLSLYQIISSVNHELFINFDVSITDAFTISGLATKIFKNSHYVNPVIPSITDKKCYNDIRKGYYGGRTEVYKPFGTNLYYYDVNSLYPSAALNPMPGLKCDYVEYNKEKGLEDEFGFFNCKIETPKDDYIGLLPYRESNKGLIFPLGKWEGWYFSEEIKLARDNGYKITLLNGYIFNKEMDVFKSYVNKLYDIKSTTKNIALKSTSKLLLNSLLGRFGLKLFKSVTKLVTTKEFQDIATTRVVNSERRIDEDTILVNYNNSIDMELCKKLNLHYDKVIMEYEQEAEFNKESYNVSVAISAAVTSYARVFMNKVKLNLLKNGVEVYYTDTDSLVINKPLPDDLISQSELGLFKLEYKVKEAYFISSKIYCLVLDDGKIIIKAKGVNNNELTLDNFKDMYKYPSTSLKTYRTESIKSYEEGFVNISKREIELNPKSYIKRNKIFDKKYLWNETKPLEINNEELLTNKIISRPLKGPKKK